VRRYLCERLCQEQWSNQTKGGRTRCHTTLDMGSQEADLPVEVGSKAIIELAHRVTKDDNRKFLDTHVLGWKNNRGPNDYAGAVIHGDPDMLSKCSRR
jgi:hypothetical protein